VYVRARAFVWQIFLSLLLPLELTVLPVNHFSSTQRNNAFRRGSPVAFYFNVETPKM
jgi:hypothetical protein